jgi:hypothetical protein
MHFDVWPNHALQRTASPPCARCLWIFQESPFRSTPASEAVAELGSLGHMDATPQTMRCESCDGSDFESLVHYGSYILRCRSCRSSGPATSWIAVGPRWSGSVRVFRDGDETGSPILEGVGSDLWREIGRLAADGTALVLR